MSALNAAAGAASVVALMQEPNAHPGPGAGGAVAGEVGGRPEAVLAGLAPGSILAGYRLEERVGAGGTAVVFRAWDGRLGRQVALKALAPALASGSDSRERFVRESRAVASVDQPHIIPIYAAGDADGVLYIAMRFVAGGDREPMEDGIPRRERHNLLRAVDHGGGPQRLHHSGRTRRQARFVQHASAARHMSHP